MSEKRARALAKGQEEPRARLNTFTTGQGFSTEGPHVKRKAQGGWVSCISLLRGTDRQMALTEDDGDLRAAGPWVSSPMLLVQA